MKLHRMTPESHLESLYATVFSIQAWLDAMQVISVASLCQFCGERYPATLAYRSVERVEVEMWKSR